MAAPRHRAVRRAARRPLRMAGWFAVGTALHAVALAGGIALLAWWAAGRGGPPEDRVPVSAGMPMALPPMVLEPAWRPEPPAAVDTEAEPDPTLPEVPTEERPTVDLLPEDPGEPVADSGAAPWSGAGAGVMVLPGVPRQRQRPPRPTPAVAGDAATTAPLAVLHQEAPAYPSRARRAGREGEVHCRIVVGADGMPVAVEIERSSGSEDLDRAARDALARWRFSAPPSATSATAVVVAFRLQ